MKLTYTLLGSPLVEVLDSNGIPCLRYFARKWSEKYGRPLQQALKLLHALGIVTLIITLSVFAFALTRGPGIVSYFLVFLNAHFWVAYAYRRFSIAHFVSRLEDLHERLQNEPKTPLGLHSLPDCGVLDDLTQVLIAKQAANLELTDGRSEEVRNEHFFRMRDDPNFSPVHDDYIPSNTELAHWSLLGLHRTIKGLCCPIPSMDDIRRWARSNRKVETFL